MTDLLWRWQYKLYQLRKDYFSSLTLMAGSVINAPASPITCKNYNLMYFGESSTLPTTRNKGSLRGCSFSLLSLAITSCASEGNVWCPKINFLQNCVTGWQVFPTFVLSNVFLCRKFKLCLASVLIQYLAVSGTPTSFLQPGVTIIIPVAYWLPLTNCNQVFPIVLSLSLRNSINDHISQLIL